MDWSTLAAVCPAPSHENRRHPDIHRHPGEPRIGAVFLVTDRGQSKRTVKALAMRVGLSLGLFLLLMAGYYFGLIPGKIT